MTDHVLYSKPGSIEWEEPTAIEFTVTVEGLSSHNDALYVFLADGRVKQLVGPPQEWLGDVKS